MIQTNVNKRKNLTAKTAKVLRKGRKEENEPGFTLCALRSLPPEHLRRWSLRTLRLIDFTI
jgi:hypothetical protein